MTRAHRTTGVARLAALTLGAVLALAPINASALTIGFFDIASELGAIIDDQDEFDDSPDANEVSITNLTAGGSSVTLQLAFFTDMNGRSVLSLTGSATAGSEGLLIDASHEGFGAGAGSPTFVNFKAHASSITGTFGAAGFVNSENDGTVLFPPPSGSAIVGASGLISDSSDMINERAAFSLNDPFAMFIRGALAPRTTATFNATLTAAVPLPAAGWLMIAGLGGLAALRRRRRAA